MDYQKVYQEWINHPRVDSKTKEELTKIADQPKEIEDRFYKELEFGTAGLRGKMAAGTNRMNPYIIRRVSQSLAAVIKEEGEAAKKRGIVMAFDTRRNSNFFVKVAAQTFAANGIKTYLYNSPRPTPQLSFSVRELNCIAGVVVTASHNPKEYNGYKVYWEEGSQIRDVIAGRITAYYLVLTDYLSLEGMPFEQGVSRGLIEIISSEMDDRYRQLVESCSLNQDVDKELSIVYSPLHGTGAVHLIPVLDHQGYKNIHTVIEQQKPDPDFTTVPYPNPEDPNAFELCILLGKAKNADLLIATDPDSDRLGSMVKNFSGDYVTLTGNQMGGILVHYILDSLSKKEALPEKSVIVTSIVTSDFGRTIAKSFGIPTIDTLTGFKNICGKANEFDRTGSHHFLFGYEESIGYVFGTRVRDKDAVSSGLLLIEAAAYYKKSGYTLYEWLNELYRRYGYFQEKMINYILEGKEGSERIQRIMERFRTHPFNEIGENRLTGVVDYANQPPEIALKTNCLKYFYGDDTWFALRPSGTEPKLKVYIYTKSDSDQRASENVAFLYDRIYSELTRIP
jgi:phosphoglucomutase